jgi:hypothetical protein
MILWVVRPGQDHVTNLTHRDRTQLLILGVGLICWFIGFAGGVWVGSQHSKNTDCTEIKEVVREKP